MSGPVLLLGALVLLGAGAWLLADWWARPVRPAARPRPRATRLERYLAELVLEGELDGWTPRRIVVASLGLGLVVGLAVYSVLGWLVPALLAAAVPGLALIGYAERRRGSLRQARQEALPEALDRLRDQLGASHGLHEAIMALADTAPPPLRSPFRHLQRDLQRRVDLVQALQASQTRLADPVWDSCVAVLALAHEFGGGQLRAVLGQLAATARADVQTRRAISAAQAGSVTSARIIGAAAVATVLYIRVGYPGADRFYASPLGEGVLLACLLTMVAGYAWMHHIASVPPTPRPQD
ncbi:MAG: type II secretion system F family protein [Chloroflexi bacterium]|nr:type II secretion system F family protein [Chloroflexota bacterium]MBV9598789.1 type II secretion system F family protein [Chloroflexota bacterium]